MTTAAERAAKDRARTVHELCTAWADGKPIHYISRREREEAEHRAGDGPRPVFPPRASHPDLVLMLRKAGRVWWDDDDKRIWPTPLGNEWLASIWPEFLTVLDNWPHQSEPGGPITYGLDHPASRPPYPTQKEQSCRIA